MNLLLLTLGFLVSIALAFMAGYQLNKDKLGGKE